MSKLISILGCGESGFGAAILANKIGYDVFVSDSYFIQNKYKEVLIKKNIKFEENAHNPDLLLKSSNIIVSPGISLDSKIIQLFNIKKIPVISEIEFAWRYAEQSNFICITGSNGKTTTTSLVYHILTNASLDVGLAGNIGFSLAYQVSEQPHKYYVVELSSFQLDSMYDFKANIAVLLNITPDHLDRYHNNFSEYIESKIRISRNQTSNDALIYCYDDININNFIAKYKTNATLYPFSIANINSTHYNNIINKQKSYFSYLLDNTLYINTNNGLFTMESEKLSLKGSHNIYNSLAAGIAAKVTDINNSTIRQSLSDFAGVEHRLEMVARIKGIDYINDSKATNVNSCWYALQTINTPIVLILGGTDKGNDYSEILEIIIKKVRALVYLGLDNSKLHNFFDKHVPLNADTHSMKDAITRATAFAMKGDTILLSPCCASFDLFKNYEDRGNQFKECVLQL
jgi:UDP-N-acetylmuramoylalanine--D-glutamate ligase